MTLRNRLLAKFRDALTWQLVRGVGELQVLTRASYVTLAFVPLLVGAWPSVRVLINSHNRVLERSTQELAEAGDKLSARADELAGTVARAATPLAEVSGEAARAASDAVTSFAAEVNSLSVLVRRELDTLRRQATLSPWLPSSWALAFFAALAVALGHLIYQWRAPPIVRRHTRDEYVRQQRDAFREYRRPADLSDAAGKLRALWWRDFKARWPQKVQSFLERNISPPTSPVDANILAAVFVDEVGRKINGIAVDAGFPTRSRSGSSKPKPLFPSDEGKLIDLERRELNLSIRMMLPIDRHRLQQEFEDRFRRAASNTESADPLTEQPKFTRSRPDVVLERLTQDIFDAPPIPDRAAAELAVQLDAVGEAATLNYDTASATGPLSMLVAGGLYLAGAVLLGRLTVQQCVAVIEAAGWW